MAKRMTEERALQLADDFYEFVIATVGHDVVESRGRGRFLLEVLGQTGPVTVPLTPAPGDE